MHFGSVVGPIETIAVLLKAESIVRDRRGVLIGQRHE
jgi:hypothetical protein